MSRKMGNEGWRLQKNDIEGGRWWKGCVKVVLFDYDSFEVVHNSLRCSSFRNRIFYIAEEFSLAFYFFV